VPQAGQLKIEDFIDRSLISELESEGFISKIYEALKRAANRIGELAASQDAPHQQTRRR
jgi:hypothetical protein